ncbi:MAG: hypothetical protein WB341_06310 [Terracidiphilus sp.]
MARFGTVNLKIRPIRFALLVDPGSTKQAREAIQLASTLWGGAYFSLIPLYKRMPNTWREGPIKAPSAKEVVLGYIDAFDPDILVQFAGNVPQYIEERGLKIIRPEEIWQPLDEGRTLAPKFGIGIPELLKDIFDIFFKYKAKYPLKVVVPVLPTTHTLFWASVYGEISPKLLPHLKKHYFEPLEITEMHVAPDDIQALFKRDTVFPRRLTQHALDHARRSHGMRSAYAFYMDVSKVEDVIDYWNLRATGRNVVPMPKQFLANDAFRALFTDFFQENRRHWPHNHAVCDFASIVRSRSSTMEEMQEFAKTFVIERTPDDPSADPFFSLQHWYPRVWDEWARDKDGVLPDDFYGEESSIEIGKDDKSLEVSFHPLLPEFIDDRAYLAEIRCANEISFRLYGSDEYLSEVFPQYSGTNFVQSISSWGSFRDYWRVGRNGLVKLVSDDFTEHWKIPESQRVVFAWLKDHGWEAELSSPGLLARQIFKTLDGNPYTLANEKLLGLLEHMNGGTVQMSGDPVLKNKIGQERDLSVGEIRSRLDDARRPSNLCDYLISKGVFAVGVRVQCPQCLRNSWHPIDRIGKELSCSKCLNTFPAIGNIENGAWRYKTTGPFSVPNYADGAYSTLLALEFFNGRKLHTMLITPAMSFTAKAPGKKDVEADFALFWQDSIFGERKDGVAFGECETYGEFQNKDLKRMRYLASTFPGAVLVFATLRKQLTPREVKAITRIARAGRKQWKNDRPINPVLILTGHELLSFFGPPQCWEEARLKNKFDRVRGLLSTCDATQQIHLGLPSWEAEWHQHREKRRMKRAKKLLEKEQP